MSINLPLRIELINKQNDTTCRFTVNEVCFEWMPMAHDDIAIDFEEDDDYFYLTVTKRIWVFKGRVFVACQPLLLENELEMAMVYDKFKRRFESHIDEVEASKPPPPCYKLYSAIAPYWGDTLERDRDKLMGPAETFRAILAAHTDADPKSFNKEVLQFYDEALRYEGDTVPLIQILSSLALDEFEFAAPAETIKESIAKTLGNIKSLDRSMLPEKVLNLLQQHRSVQGFYIP